MKIVDVQNKITNNELASMSEKMFGNLVKAVIDTEKRIMAVDAEMHADEEAKLLETGSNQQNIWGINFYPEFFSHEDFVEFDSMINLRPSQNNRSRGVEDEKIRSKILEIISELVAK